MEYYAHIVSETGNKQTLLDHLQNTAAMAAGFAAEFDGEDIGALCGLLHDIGKYSDQFQRRLKGSTERVDHSTAGALEASRLGNAAAAFCISGHHSGLPDGGTKKSATPEDAHVFRENKACARPGHCGVRRFPG